MTLSEISATDVRSAVALHDELGRAEFLRRYGFGSAQDYVLDIDGRAYPSKAVVGVAHEFATGVALTSGEFTGGRGQAVPVLESLGFRVKEKESEATAESAACMLLWNPKSYEWPDEARLEILVQTMLGGTAIEDWSIYANSTKVAIGDRVFLRKTGARPRGVVASGRVTAPAYLAGHWGDASKKPTTYVQVTWDAMVDPADVFELDPIAERFPGAAWGAPGGGARISPESLPVLEREWASHVERTLAGYGSIDGERGSFAEEIEARYGRAWAKVRRHQKAFRELLLRELDHRCEFPGCPITAVELLEAAHIIPDSEGGKPVFDNGLLLCRNHHRAMDAHLVAYLGDGGFEWAEGVEEF